MAHADLDIETDTSFDGADQHDTDDIGANDHDDLVMARRPHTTRTSRTHTHDLPHARAPQRSR